MRGGYFGTRPFGVPGWSCGYCLWRCRCSRAPSGPAAREIATRELRSEWSISKPARALRTLRRPPHRQRWVVVCGGQALPPPTDTATIPPGPAAPSALRTHVVSCVADPGGRILIRTGGIVLREVSGKASPGPLQAFWSRGGYESMSGCDRASQAHTEAPGAVAPGALAAIRCEPSEPNATRSVAA